MRGTTSLTEDLLASQEDLDSVELVGVVMVVAQRFLPILVLKPVYEIKTTWGSSGKINSV